MPLNEIALAESINAASEGEPPNMSLLAVSNERACGASDGHPLRCWRLVAGAAGEVAGDLTPLPPTINRDNQRVLALTMGLLGNTACVLLGDRTLECWSTTENQPLDIWPHQDP